MNTPHKHRDLIIAWANGETIEVYSNGRWEVTLDPVWIPSVKYRVKPDIRTRLLQIIHRYVNHGVDEFLFDDLMDVFDISIKE